MTQNIDITKRYELLQKMTHQAAEYLDRMIPRETIEIKMKLDNDPTTGLDLTIEKMISASVRQAFPEDAILAEESSDGEFSKYAEHPAVWIIDPLDGTKNYIHDLRNFATGIAFVSHGQPLLAGIAFADGSFNYVDVKQEPGNFSRLSKTPKLSWALVGMDLPKTAAARKRGVEIAAKCWSAGVSGVRCMGSAVADCWRVSDGQLDAYLHTGLSPWDVAAPAAFVLAAGGRITRLDGSPWNVFCPDVLASNRLLHSRLLSLVNCRDEVDAILTKGPSKEELEAKRDAFAFTLPGREHFRDLGVYARNAGIEQIDESGIYRITFVSTIDLSDGSDGHSIPSNPRAFDVLYDPLVREGYILSMDPVAKATP